MSSGASQRYFGVYLAMVVDVDDPDGFGRIRLATDQYRDTSDQPVWASVSRPLAGDVSTVFFTPKPDDQVVISYIAGDVRQPIVLGYAHGVDPDRKPRTDDVGARKHSIVIKDVGRITFDEEDGSIDIHHASSAAYVKLTNDGDVQISGARTLVMSEPLQQHLEAIATDLGNIPAIARGIPATYPTARSALPSIATQHAKGE